MLVFIVLFLLTLLFLSFNVNSSRLLKTIKRKTVSVINFKKNESLFICIAVISILLAIYIYALDICSVVYNYDVSTDEIVTAELHHVSPFVFVCDSIILLGIVIIAIYSCCNCFKSILLESLFVILFLVVITVIHLPFIA